MSGPRVCFAPPANRSLRPDEARTALFGWLFARAHRGTFIVRIDDDGGDASPAGELAPLRDLEWLGLAWDEGIEAGGDQGLYRRSLRLDRYRQDAAALLRERRAYACFCAPDDAEAGGRPAIPGRDIPGGGCAGGCRALSREAAQERRGGAPAVVRLDAALALAEEEVVRCADLVQGELRVPAGSIGDFVLLRRDGRPSAVFAAAVDDRAMAVTHAVRGDDRRPESARQALVHRALGEGAPPAFAHLPIILDAGGGPPGEEGPAASIAGLREQGYPPEAVLNHLALLGWTAPGGQEILTLEELMALFDLQRVDRTPAVFEMRRLDTIAARHMARLSPDRIGGLAAERLAAAGRLPERPSRQALDWAGRLAMLYAERLPRMQDLVVESAFLFDFDPRALRADGRARAMMDDPQSRSVARAVEQRLGQEPMTAPRFQALADAVRRETGAKGRALYDPLRLALTGAASGPELVRLLPVIEEGSRLALPRPIASCARRAHALCALLDEEGR